MEDWDLWGRMLRNGAEAANLDTVVLKVRAGDALYGRRGGLEYAREEVRQQIDFLRNGFVTPVQAARNVGLRVLIRLVPNFVRAAIYQRFARHHNGEP
jgi:hypothetical protein